MEQVSFVQVERRSTATSRPVQMKDAELISIADGG